MMSSFLVAVLAFSSVATLVASDCAAPWGKCAGRDYGSKCCTTGYSCMYENEWYSQCKPSGTNCSSLWGQCGGEGWQGAKCCSGGSTCVPQAGNKWYSQCLPKTDVKECSVLYGQCGGEGWKGSLCCASGSKCVPQANNRWYSQCLPVSTTPTPTPGDVSKVWEQCGGLKWAGPTKCESGTHCVPQANNPWYSQCLPVAPTPSPTPTVTPPTAGDACKNYLWDQCGGLFWEGQTCCKASKCVPQINNPWYSQCLPEDAVVPADQTFSLVVLGKTAATLTDEDKLNLRTAVSLAAGVSVAQVFIKSIVDGVSSSRRLSDGRALDEIDSTTITFFIQDFSNVPVLSVVQSNTTLDLSPACPNPLKPLPSGLCVCPDTKKVPVNGSCVVYGKK